MMVLKKWQRFEALAAEIQRELAPMGAVVTQNERIRGVFSQRSRELDIVVRLPVGEREMLTVIDCKDYPDPVDVKDVEAFIGLAEDVDANKAAMVAARGYSTAAKNRAAHAGVCLLNLVDIENAEWPSFLKIPVLVEMRYPVVKFQASIQGRTPAFRREHVSSWELEDRDGSALGTPASLAAQLWNAGLLDSNVFEHRGLRLASEPTFASLDGARFQADFEVDVRVDRRCYLGGLPLAKARGFLDSHDGIFYTRGFTTEWIVWTEVERTFDRVLIDELSVKPMMHIVTDANVSADGKLIPFPSGSEDG